jgi:Domain of unknown function (DUF4962)/Heparinase II/III-like protein
VWQQKFGRKELLRFDSTCAVIRWGLLVAAVCIPATLCAQGKGEELGRADTGGKAIYLMHAMQTLHSQLKPEYMGVHPRIYFTDAELDVLRARAHGPEKSWWQHQLSSLRVLKQPPPPPPAQARREQNDVGLAIAEGAFAYRIERDPHLLKLTKAYMDAAVSYPVWGYSWSKPNVDLAAGHLLYGMGLAYDLLYHDLTPQEREIYRSCIARHGHILYEYFAPKPGRKWTYSQNHTFIPIAGLGVAAYAVYGEVPEAAKWAALSRAIYSRVLATYSKDGYYYEGFEYWVFATPWIVHYLDALKHATGEDLFDQPGLRKANLYAAYSMTPGGQLPFDFGDVYEGAMTRAHQGEAYPRTHPGGHYETNYNLLYDLAAEFDSPQIQGVADWLRSLGQTSQEEWWTLAWRNPKLASTPITELKPWHWFHDHDVVYWRSGWGADATAIAFKCGPPEGHSTRELIRKYPGWRLEDGHVHPDVNSFIVWAHGAYLTGNSGYAGVPRSSGANTLLVNGEGQGHEGGHNAWKGMSYDLLNRIRIVKAVLGPNGFDIEGEGAGAYDPLLGLTKYLRKIEMTTPGHIVVEDHIASSKPDVYSEILHADVRIIRRGPRAFTLEGDGGTLKAILEQPIGVDESIEKNVVMGPGKPGSVQSGSLQQRGERLIVKTNTPQVTEEFLWDLSD